MRRLLSSYLDILANRQGGRVCELSGSKEEKHIGEGRKPHLVSFISANLCAPCSRSEFGDQQLE